jgi:hypothetical protein
MMAGLAAVRVKLHRKRRMDEAGETAIASVAAVVLETLGLAG